jgi:hypothetical protein
MKKILITTLLAITPIASLSQPALIKNMHSADLSKIHEIRPEIDSFRFWYGDISSGELIYLSDQRPSGFETELHVRFTNRRISSYLLILGPGGINSENCINRYRKVVKMLNKKHGSFVFQEVVKDPIINELISLNTCDPVRIGIFSIKTFWKTDKLAIMSQLIGDNEGFYIEIEFTSNKYSPKKLDKKLFKLL